MASKKVTFTFDDATLARLARAARRLDQPKSQVVRDAIREYSERIGRLSEQERLRMLRVFDEVVPRIPERPEAEVERELRAVRSARHDRARHDGARHDGARHDGARDDGARRSKGEEPRG